MIGYTPYVRPEDTSSLSTPQPVYAANDFKGTARPERLPVPHELRAKTAAAHALRLYPGPVGDVLSEALLGYADLGWLARADTPIARLVDHLLTQPLPPAELPGNVA